MGETRARTETGQGITEPQVRKSTRFKLVKSLDLAKDKAPLSPFPTVQISPETQYEIDPAEAYRRPLWLGGKFKHGLASLNKLREHTLGLKDLRLRNEDNLRNRPYLAWEMVRKNRAAELVGTVRKPDGKGGYENLPYTGFEGYFVGKTPAEIIQEEIKLGHTILRSIHYYAESETNSGISEIELSRPLSGGTIAPRYANEILRFWNDLLITTLARAKGALHFEDQSKFRDFQDGTYKAIDHKASLPSKTNKAVTDIESVRDIRAYTALAEIGILGHPYLRSAIKKAA